MKEPVWLPEAVLLAVQEELLDRFGGLAGVRDAGLLTSALDRPRNHFAYGEQDLFVLAASYAGGIIRNHPFNDGSKRAGFMAAYIFLEANGLSFEASEEEVLVFTRGLAAGEIDEAVYARWLHGACSPPAGNSPRPVD